MPIGRAARIAFDIDTMRASCSSAAEVLLSAKRVDEQELEECAQLDEALDHAHRILKNAIRQIMLSRLNRRSRRTRSRS